ncbi:MAG: type I-E CRISPR-associated protein Cse2/CasB [Desulfomonilaceae bacterium]
MLAKGCLNFSPDSAVSTELHRWWQSLEEARGDRKNLRRCRNLVSVVFVPAYYRLRGVLLPLGTVDDEALAAVAGILAHVKNHMPDYTFAEQMAQPKMGGTRPRVSGLRFRRLLQFQNHCELYPALIRTVRLLDGAVNLHSLASSTYRWNDSVRKQWAYSYYGTAPTAD